MGRFLVIGGTHGIGRQVAAKRHPMQTVGDPASIARAVVYLSTDEACWVTGQVLGVDGGLSTLSLF